MLSFKYRGVTMDLEQWLDEQEEHAPVDDELAKMYTNKREVEE